MIMKKLIPAYLTILAAFTACTPKEASDNLEVSIRIDATQTMGPVQPVWRFFGADEPNYAYMPNGRKLLHDLGALDPGRVYFRAHNLLTTGDGKPDLKWGSTNIYTEDDAGNPVYSWTIIDSIFDAYLENGVRPYVEIGFMPEALSTNPEPYRHHWNPELPYNKVYTGWAYPPADYEKWEELIYQWTKHCVERYGKEEVEHWYWETWNEPNIPYWQGSLDEFLKLHDYAVQGVLRAFPEAKVGGPDVAGTGRGQNGVNYFSAFVDHCLNEENYVTGEKGTKLDFISFHAKGSPEFMDGHVRMGIRNQLSVIDNMFKLISENPEIKDLPVVIGESDPEGCAACQGEQLGYRNGTMYSSYTAASFVRKLDLALKYDINFDGALTWAFEFEDQPWFAGFRALSTNGINKPVMNVFRMFSMMEGIRIKAQSNMEVPLDSMLKKGVRTKPDIAACASMDDNTLYIMAWYYHDDDLPGPDASVSIQMTGLPERSGKSSMDIYLIDQNHSNSYTAWQAMGSPQNPDPAQYRLLEEKSRLEKTVEGKRVKIRNNSVSFDLELKRQGVVMMVLNIN